MEDVVRISEELIFDCATYAVQRFVGKHGTLNPDFGTQTTFSDEDINKILPELQKNCRRVIVR
jgi:hypothetical protein